MPTQIPSSANHLVVSLRFVGDAGADRLPVASRPPLTFTWSDELTAANGHRLEEVVPVVLTRVRPPEALIDIERCPYLSEDGLSALIGLQRRAEAVGVALRVRAAGQPRAKILVAGLGPHLLDA